jgi:hypothetical protein
MEKRRGRSNGSKSQKSPNMADALNELSGAQRSDYDSHPKACSHRTNLRRREALDPAPNTQKRALQRVAHLHESETPKK